MSSNSIPVKMIASRNTEILSPRDAATRQPISLSALYTNRAAPEMKMNIDVMPAASFRGQPRPPRAFTLPAGP
jgi:hypothetical protein